MLKYFVHRLWQTMIVLVGVTLITFIMVNIVPGDPAAVMMEKKADQATIDRIRDQLGLNDPLPTQYLRFVKSAVTGDFGDSYFHKRPVSEMLKDGFIVTGKIAIGVLAFSIVIGTFSGVMAAVFRGTIIDKVIMFISTLGMAAPSFWLAIVLQLIFGLWLKALPISGLDSAKSYILPSIALGLIYSASLARLARTNMLDALHQDYVRTARSKGVGELAIIFIHSFKNALIPILTYLGTMIKNVLGGSVLVETIFAINGIGTLLIDGIMKRDIPVIQGVTVYLAVIFVVANLLIDLTYGLIDPRVRIIKEG